MKYSVNDLKECKHMQLSDLKECKHMQLSDLKECKHMQLIIRDLSLKLS